MAILLGFYIQFWGVLFIVSYWFPEASYLLKFLIWLCKNYSTPRGAWTALLWGTFAISIGFLPLLIGLGVLSP